MNDASAQPFFPFVRTAMLLTVCALAAGGLAWLGLPGSGQGTAIATTVVLVWAVSLISLLLVASYAPRGARAMAMAHFAAAGGRVALCIIGGLIAVVRLGLPATPVLIGLAAFYFPLLMIESICVSRHIRSLCGPGKEALR